MMKELEGRPSAGDAHLLSAAEALRLWICSDRADILGANRVAAMMTALAAEAYVNAALMTLLDRRDFEAVDRLSTPEKFFVGLSIGEHNLGIERSSHHGENLMSLFRVRNKLTHSKLPEEAALLPPRIDVGRWLSSVALIVSEWPSRSEGAIPEAFARYTAPFGSRVAGFASSDGMIQLHALGDALAVCSTFDLLMASSELTDGITLIRTDVGEPPLEPCWIRDDDGEESIRD